MMVDKTTRTTGRALIEVEPEIVMMNFTNLNELGNSSIGLDGTGRVGF